MKRRDLIKWSLLSGGAALAGPKAVRNVLSFDKGPGGGGGGGGDDGGGTVPTSPATRAFVSELPIMPLAQPLVVPLDPPVNPAAHQRFNEFVPKKFYEMFVRESSHQFHPDLPPSTIWGYNGIHPGPTFHSRYGEPILVRIHNELPANHVGFGIPEIITHLHNAHTATESDGFPGDFYPSGRFKDHHYCHMLAGRDERETLGLLWYHDHRFDFTSQNVYKGMAGIHLLFDAKDSGDENDPNPAAFRLPSGDYDVPLLLQDKIFDANGELFFDQFNTDGILGDKFVVNGQIQPFFKVARRKYRFRIVDGGPSRFYELFLSSGQPFIQISNDGNLLPRPLSVQSVRLGVAQRADVIVDFSRYNIGDQVFLQNRLEQTSGRGPTGNILNPGTPLLRFDVDRDAPDSSRIPATLRALPPVNMSEVVATRTWRFERTNGAWAINGQFFDTNVIRANPRRGTAEIWVLQNNSGGWSHPIHIHFEEFQILSRNGAPPPPHEVARKDVVILGPNETVRLFLRFRDFTGRYPMHCHNLVHEDHRMMLRWDIVP
jgi:FtsP/CotA-like multicopper oxidase with cupredoxin domain